MIVTSHHVLGADSGTIAWLRQRHFQLPCYPGEVSRLVRHDSAGPKPDVPSHAVCVVEGPDIHQLNASLGLVPSGKHGFAIEVSWCTGRNAAAVYGQRASQVAPQILECRPGAIHTAVIHVHAKVDLTAVLRRAGPADGGFKISGVIPLGRR